MKNSKIEYFYFEPYIHINLNSNKALIYNTFTNKFLILKESQLIDNIKNSLQNNRNGFIIENSCVKEKCKELRTDFFGEIIELESKTDSPFVIPTEFFKVEKNLNYLLNSQIRSFGNGIQRSFKELDLYLDNSFYKDFTINNQIPFIYNHPNIKNSALFEFITNLVKNESLYLLNKINIYVKKFTQENLNLIKKIEDRYGNFILNIHFENKNIDKIFDININKVLYYTFDDKECLTAYNNLSISTKETIKIIFVVENEKQFELSESLISQYHITNYNYKPYYNGKNLKFFEDNIYLDEESIFFEKKNKEEIFLNKEINETDFGKVIIFNDGQYCTNNFKPNLGNVDHDNIDQILNNCYFSENSSWFLTRNKVSVCKDCVYNQLCPPVSIYEHAIGRFNLCNVIL